jgi:hypothetical protein
LGHENLNPIYIRVGEINRKYQERVIGFGILVKETEADLLWEELSNNFKKNTDIGDFEFEITHPNEFAPGKGGEATIILEIPIALNNP